MGDHSFKNGFQICSGCGKTFTRFFETKIMSFSQSNLYFPKGYSRKSRFEKKVLGALRCLNSHKVDEKLMAFLKTKNIETPQQLLKEIGRFRTKGRRPYMFSMYYWKALGKTQPIVLEKDMELLKKDFDQIFFAWERLNFKNPKFPYNYTFKKIVTGNKKYSLGLRALVPFVRNLRCVKRRERYDRLFELCNNFDFKQIHFKQINMEKINYPETTIYLREKCQNQRIISANEMRNVYQTSEEVASAIKNKTFDVAKTMTIGKDGKFYFLQYPSQLEPLPEKTQFQKEAMKKLDDLLKKQSLL